MQFFNNRTYKLKIAHSGCDTTKYVSLANELEFTSNELLHAIVTCGMPLFYLRSSRIGDRFNEILFKVFAMESALDIDGDRIIKSKNMNYLDRSEQSAINYWVGMFFTKLISEKIFDVTYLIHLDIAEMMYNVKTYNRLRPDFIGYSIKNNEYSVFEAKGRQRCTNALNHALNQIKTIKTISGNSPKLRVANLVYFNKGILMDKLIDPESDDGISLDLSFRKMVEIYYMQIIKLYNDSEFDKCNDGFLRLVIPYLNDERIIVRVNQAILDMVINTNKDDSYLKQYLRDILYDSGDGIVVEYE